MSASTRLVIPVVCLALCIIAPTTLTADESDATAPLAVVVANYEIAGTTIPITQSEYNKARQSLEQHSGSLLRESNPDELIRLIMSCAIAMHTVGASAPPEPDDPSLMKEIAQERRRQLLSLYSETLVNRIPPPDDGQIEELYKQNEARFQVGPKIRARFIVAYADNTSDPVKMAEARRRIEEASRHLREGKKFEEVAVMFSNMPSEDPMGNIVDLDPDKIQPGVARNISNLTNGQTSEPFKFAHGYMILRLEERKKASVLPLDQALRKQIANMALDNTRSQLWKKNLEALKTRRPVKIMPKTIDSCASDTVILEIGDKKYTKTQVAEAIRVFDRLVPGGSGRALQDQVPQFADQEIVVQAAEGEGLGNSRKFLAEMEDFSREQRVSRRIAAILNENVTTPSEAELTAYFYAHGDEFMTRKETRIGLIEVRARSEATSASSNNQEREAANIYWEAQKAYSLLKKGEPFEKVHKQFGTGGKDGVLEFSAMGPRGRVIDMAVDKMKIGDISQPLQSKNGFYVIQLLDVKQPKAIEFDSARDRVRQCVSAVKRSATLRNFFDQMAQKHHLTVVHPPPQSSKYEK
ncbi:MAG: peptidylprolyl isomerase [Candidatus Sumerlaeota bacterium]|nr:peptidylprolyl isomerase [Candidatus Sumerlaeota bacterium]